jgi:hypothetical protein
MSFQKVLWFLTALRQLSHYLWAFPASLFGLVFVPLAWLSGGTVRPVQGVLEIQGGVVAILLRKLPVFGPAAAMTLGHSLLPATKPAWTETADMSTSTSVSTSVGGR